jgi:hypothetical protein
MFRHSQISLYFNGDNKVALLPYCLIALKNELLTELFCLEAQTQPA